jgi:hypothetical protein
MSAPINDGGQAFPHFKIDPYSSKVEICPQGGMTLRDYFAGQALAGMLMNYTTAKFGLAEISVANHAYKLADAMLAAREAGK